MREAVLYTLGKPDNAPAGRLTWCCIHRRVFWRVDYLRVVMWEFVKFVGVGVPVVNVGNVRGGVRPPPFGSCASECGARCSFCLKGVGFVACS